MEYAAIFAPFFDPSILGFALLGVVIGISLGALPGLDATMGVAILIPLTYALQADHSLVLFAALYAGGVFGASITGILFRIPGTSEALMTTIEGHEFTRRGEANLALGIAIGSSVIAGLFACIVLYTATPLLANVALRFGQPEYFALGVLGLCLIVTVSASSPVRGGIAAMIGILLGLVGIDPLTGEDRLTFGLEALRGGVPFVPAIVGLFAASEVLNSILERKRSVAESANSKSKRFFMPQFGILQTLKGTIARSGILGVLVGILPGAGATTASVLAYSIEQQVNPDKAGYGKGKPAGLAAPEAANNAAAVGAMVPLLALGIPGSGTTAVMIGAFLIHNLQPGPLLFQNSPDLAYAIFAGMTVANIAILFLSLVMVQFFARLTTVPYPILAVAILSVCICGTLAYGDVNALLIMVVFAIFGVLFHRLDYPAAPLILGMVLAPIVEQSFRRAMMIAGNDITQVIFQPIAGTILSLAILSIAAPPFLSRLKRKIRREQVS